MFKNRKKTFARYIRDMESIYRIIYRDHTDHKETNNPKENETNIKNTKANNVWIFNFTNNQMRCKIK